MRGKRQHFEKDAVAPTLDYAHLVPLISHSSSLWDGTTPKEKVSSHISSLPLEFYARAFTSSGKHQASMGKQWGGSEAEAY